MSSFLPQEIIRKKRDGEALDDDAIRRMVTGIADGSVSEGQIGAFAMAVYLNGMTNAEQAILTHAMTHSGRVLDWSGTALDGPIVDKHSTGGVGDKVSLILAPIVAACGAFVPMISGRGLGHSGGTLDKLQAIPGYNATPSLDDFMRITKDVGCSIIGQTGELAPADRRLYAIRDVTATVESFPLITASILSKKLAAGLGSLVMDVKFGSGAFMRDTAEARALAENIVAVAGESGVPARAVLTDMNQVLGHTAGNALEIVETINFFKGTDREARLEECTLALAAEMLLLAGVSADQAAGRAKAKEALESGRAAEIFARMVAAHGGANDLMAHPEKYLAAAPVIRPVTPEKSGYVSAMDTRAIGMAVVDLGGGRRRADDKIDPAVGLSVVAGIGDEVGPDAPLATVHARDDESAEEAAAAIVDAVTITGDAPGLSPVVGEIISA